MSSARVIVDTNVLISRLLIPPSAAGRAVNRLVKHARVLVSEDTLAELARTIVLEKFNRCVSLEDRHPAHYRCSADRAGVGIQYPLAHSTGWTRRARRQTIRGMAFHVEKIE
jgi:hypothetical protein